MEVVWDEYGMEQLEQGMSELFPEYEISLTNLLDCILAGDLIGVLGSLFSDSIGVVLGQVDGMKNILLWLVILGIVSALMTHFVEIFDRHQVADLSFYYMYLLMSAVMLKCFAQAVETTLEVIENIILFVKILFPTYLLAIGVANGATTVGAYSQLLILIIYGVEKILLSVVLPLIFTFLILTIINTIWVGEKLSLMIDLVKKGVGFVLHVSIGIVTGISLFQSVITPMVDSAQRTALQKAVSVIPGIGSVTNSVVELATGAAVIIRNTIGVALFSLLLLLCLAPLFKIFLTMVLFKCAAALMGIVSDRRITSCADQTGDATLLLLRTAGTAMLLFLIIIAIVATSTGI